MLPRISFRSPYIQGKLRDEYMTERNGFVMIGLIHLLGHTQLGFF